ncbi:hypothetical protein E4P40_20870 [Blastococcus sp. CT_GayMR20]|uniref:hypothetical protein n=1 Tax=Blastococcus sp. CT_GayMR20 TaxID=2559609 RepID=UPI0010749B8F|nr:hypothetical protein [Blastococcus sp. CT_GayMR20]TFV71645.1 hypothetical protein E4P40_20870 [Blastococcus sp. CT_GayMR20]
MTSGGALLVLFLLFLAYVAVTTVVVAVRGGRGPADPPASHLRVDPAGFPVRTGRAATAAAAVSRTARESRTSRPMSRTAGGGPSPSIGRATIRVP